MLEKTQSTREDPMVHTRKQAHGHFMVMLGKDVGRTHSPPEKTDHGHAREGHIVHQENRSRSRWGRTHNPLKKTDHSHAGEAPTVHQETDHFHAGE